MKTLIAPFQALTGALLEGDVYVLCPKGIQSVSDLRILIGWTDNMVRPHMAAANSAAISIVFGEYIQDEAGGLYCDRRTSGAE